MPGDRRSGAGWPAWRPDYFQRHWSVSYAAMAVEDVVVVT